MTEAQKRVRELMAEQSRERQRMAELAATGDLTDETRAELDTLEKGTPDLERKIRAARQVAEAEADAAAETRETTMTTETGDERELRELRGRVRLSGYVTAAIEQRGANGAEAEYNQARGIAGNTASRSKCLRHPSKPARPPSSIPQPRRPVGWIRLFAGTASERVGITMESVPAGTASFPVTTAGATAAQRAKSQVTADAVWTIGVTEMKPKRNAVRLVFNVEDAARIPGLEAALTRDLRAALVEGVDRAIFLGDAGGTGTGADITGLSTATGLTEKAITQANKLKGSNVVQVFAELIDGAAAMTPADLRAVFSVGANALWSHTLANSGAAVDTTIAEFLRRFGLDWLTRGEIETNTENGDFGAFIGLGRGLEGAGVAALWDTGEIIRDFYSGASKGEVALTLSYLWSFDLPRASNFARVTFA